MLSIHNTSWVCSSEVGQQIFKGANSRPISLVPRIPVFFSLVGAWKQEAEEGLISIQEWYQVDVCVCVCVGGGGGGGGLLSYQQVRLVEI